MYSRGKFGIEFSPPERDDETSWLGRILLIAIVVVVVIAIVVFVRYLKSHSTTNTTVEVVETPALPTPPTASNNAVVAQSVKKTIDYSGRSTKVRNLLLRLAEAERMDNVEMAVSTIEQLRSMPGIADLDDTLARRLGALNMRRLFELKSEQWTKKVPVKHGDTVSRIAAEHGSTTASIIKLNGDSDRVVAGKSVIVLNHPRFELVISRRTGTADLSLNGKFFKRYYLIGEVRGKEGQYPISRRFRDFCTDNGVGFKMLDRAELEMLLPKGASAFIKEI